MKTQPIILVVAVSLLAGCDLFQEQWEGTNARTIIEQVIPHEITKNTFDVIWEGDNDGHSSYVVKAEYTFTDGAGRKTLACTVVGYTHNEELGNLLWNRQTGVVPGDEISPEDPRQVSAFAEANALGRGRFKPRGLVEEIAHRWFGL